MVSGEPSLQGKEKRVSDLICIGKVWRRSSILERWRRLGILEVGDEVKEFKERVSDVMS